MAAASQTTGTRDRRLLVTSLVILGGVTGAAFGRVFAGSAVALRLAVAGVLAVAIAAALQRRNLLLSLLVSTAVLAVTIGVVVFPETTWYGAPTTSTFESIIEALGHVGRRAAQEVAPARPLPALLTAALLAVWAASTAAHALAIRSHSAVLPVLPGAALLAFAGVVTEDGPRPGYVIAFLIAGFAVLFACGLERMRLWGPVILPPGGRGRLGGGASARWARWMAVGAVVVALILPGILPGFESGPILRLKADAGRINVSPIVDIRPSLLRNPPADLFSVEALQPTYWRMVALDRFDGRLWTSSNLYAEGSREVNGTELLGDILDVEGVRLEQRFEIQDLSTPWLPAAFRPVEISLERDQPVRHDSATGMLVREEETEEGFAYTVTSQVVVPTIGALDNAYLGITRDALIGSAGEYIGLPDSVPARIYGIAQTLAAGRATPFREVMAIQEHLRQFTYDEKARPGHGIDDMLFFLDSSHRGYCEQFAGTMAVLVRALGYPARVAIGFLPGDRGRDGRFRVTTDHIHAWPEVFFPGFGWLPFEPTPTRSNPLARYLAQVPSGIRPDANLGGDATPSGQSRGAAQRDAFEALPTPGTIGAVPVPRRAPAETEVPWSRIALALLAMALAVSIIIPLGKSFGRRLALARAGTPRRKVIAAYAVFEAGAADLGLGRRVGETVWEYRSRLRSRVAFSNGHLDRMTSLTGLALYSDAEVGTEDAREAVAAARSALSDVRRQAGAVRRAAGAVRPSRPL